MCYRHFLGQPLTLQLEILYPATALMIRPEIQMPPQYHKIIFTGAESIYPKYEHLRPQTNAEAIGFVRGYLQDCADSDNPDCFGTGGHVHVAEITPQESRWIIPPLALPPTGAKISN
jgi:hypothetical protein